MDKIKKAVIPVAGKGTRFLPVTKTVIKTMFPIINKPTIHYIVEEVVRAGITDIILVISNNQRWVKDYFDNNSSYYDDLHKKYKELETLEKLNDKINIKYVIQLEPKGLGHALLCAKRYIGNDDFALLLGDDLVQRSDEKHYGIIDLVKKYKKNPAYYIGVVKVKEEETSKYGIISYSEELDGNMKLDGMVEKPTSNPPSLYAACGRYILRNSIFKYIKQTKTKPGQEIQLTTGLDIAIQNELVLAREIVGNRFDVGSHLGYVKATVAYALKDENLKDEVRNYISSLVNND